MRAIVNRTKTILAAVMVAFFGGYGIYFAVTRAWLPAAVFLVFAFLFGFVLVRYGSVLHVDDEKLELKFLGLSRRALPWSEVREMGLIKRMAGGRPVYALPQTPPREAAGSGYVRVMREAVRQMTPAGNLLVIRTVTGMAMAVAAAIDSLRLPELVGDIAGDDTVFCAAGTPEDALELKDKLQEMIGV